MKYINAEIALTCNLGGALAVRGKYDSVVKTDDKGNKIISIERNEKTGEITKAPVYLLRTLQLPSYKECHSSTILNNHFVQWALSDDSKPRDMSASYWKRMPEKMKLKYHVTKYVHDMFGKCEFKYIILE